MLNYTSVIYELPTGIGGRPVFVSQIPMAPLLCRDAFDATSPMSPSRSRDVVPPTVNAKGTLRMKREDPSKTEQLVKCVSLPSLKASNMSQMSLTSMNSMKGRRSHDF